MKKLIKIIVSENSFKDEEPYKIISSNISVINVLREEGAEIDQIHDDAMLSYYVDFYLAQYNNGNFLQFVWNTKWSDELNDEIKIGLEKIGAVKHLELFNQQCEKVAQLSEEELNSFLENEYFGENKTRDLLKNDAFFDIDENLIELNSQWLKNHKDLWVLSIDDMFEEIENFVGHKIEKY